MNMRSLCKKLSITSCGNTLETCSSRSFTAQTSVANASRRASARWASSSFQAAKSASSFVSRSCKSISVSIGAIMAIPMMTEARGRASALGRFLAACTAAIVADDVEGLRS